MARIDYDEDDDAGQAGDRPRWRRRLITGVLVAAGLGLGFLIPYATYLNHEVGQRFGQLRWQLPTRVYARPLELAPGIALDAATLKTELEAAAYRAGDGRRAGTYAHDGSRWTIASRGFNDVDGAVRALRGHGLPRSCIHVPPGRLRAVPRRARTLLRHARRRLGV